MTTRTLDTRTASSGMSPVARIGNALAVWRQRRRLERLDPHLLRDIGLTREAAMEEASRPFWDAPGHWLR